EPTILADGELRTLDRHVFFQAEAGIRAFHVTGVQTCALPISRWLVGLWRSWKSCTIWIRRRATTVTVSGSRSFVRPSVDVRPERANSFSDEVLTAASVAGLDLDPRQVYVVDAGRSADASGRLISSRCGVSVPRQNGKTAMLEARALYGAVFLHEKILWTAHESKTASAAFRRLRELLGGRLAGRVRSFQGALGREAIWLEDGGSIQFIARSKSSGRGFTADLLIMDEAQELSDDALAALLPTISAAPLGNPQQILAGTP